MPTPRSTNRADGGLYSPGSTFKLVTATAGLRTGIITPGSTYVDNGYVEVGGQRFTNDAGDGALGPIALPTAITRSSNVYFFNIGEKLWQGRSHFGETALQNTASDYGFGALTGLDLPDEKAVPLPTPKERAKLHHDKPKAFPTGGWYTGDTMNLAIGQGDLLVTPLQLANAYGQFANGGDRFQPTILRRVLTHFAPLDDQGNPRDPKDVIVENAPHKTGHIDYAPDWHAAMMQGFSGVTQNQAGTAASAFQGFPMAQFPIAGKTGTAETGIDPATGQEKFSNAFFVGFGPTTDPAYVGVAVLEQAGYGAAAAAPVVRSMLEPVARTGTWPTVKPTIPLAPPPPPSTTTTAPAATTVPGSQSNQGAPSTTTLVPGQVTSNTTETTTPGAVATGGR